MTQGETLKPALFSLSFLLTHTRLFCRLFLKTVQKIEKRQTIQFAPANRDRVPLLMLKSDTVKISLHRVAKLKRHLLQLLPTTACFRFLFPGANFSFDRHFCQANGRGKCDITTDPGTVYIGQMMSTHDCYDCMALRRSLHTLSKRGNLRIKPLPELHIKEHGETPFFSTRTTVKDHCRENRPTGNPYDTLLSGFLCPHPFASSKSPRCRGHILAVLDIIHVHRMKAS